MSGSVCTPGNQTCVEIKNVIQDMRNKIGRPMLVRRRAMVFIKAVFISVEPFLSFAEGSSGSVTTQNKEQMEEDTMLIPLPDLL